MGVSLSLSLPLFTDHALVHSCSCIRASDQRRVYVPPGRAVSRWCAGSMDCRYSYEGISFSNEVLWKVNND